MLDGTLFVVKCTRCRNPGKIVWILLFYSVKDVDWIEILRFFENKAL